MFLKGTITGRLLATHSPVDFHREYLRKALPVLDAWQVDACREQGRNMLFLCGRQTGKSTVASLLAVHTVAMREDKLVLLISPTQRQSSELFRKCMVLFDTLEEPPAHVSRTKTALELENGSSIYSLPGANPDTIRGYSQPDLIIEDEAAFVGDGTFLASRPMLATSERGRHILLSTPYGRRGHFYDLWSGDDPDWRRFTIKSADCPRIASSFLEGERRIMSDRSYRQEYQCEFLEAATAVFPADVIERLVDDDERHKIEPMSLRDLTVADPGAWGDL